MATPLWYLLLLNWKNAGRSGLTLPFLVGAEARRRGSTTATEHDVRHLLNDMSGWVDDRHAVLIRSCPGVEAVVCEVIARHHTSTSGKTGLVFDQPLLNKWGPDPASVFNALVRQCVPLVTAGRFSRVSNGGMNEWASFQPSDIEFIDAEVKASTIPP